jgi:hypothetical protein
VAHELDFQIFAMDDLLKRDLPADLDGGVKSRELLEIIAAIAPVRLSEESAALIAEEIGAKGDGVVRGINHLEENGLILRRGATIRIRPDVLADHLLFRAAVSEDSVTGFVDRVFARFSRTHLSNILRNAAELQWRCTALGSSVDVLEVVFQRVDRDLSGATLSGRIGFLAVYKGAAIFLPERSLKLVRSLLSTRARTDSEDSGVPEEFVQQLYVDHLSSILRVVALHAGYGARCASLLWELGKDDERKLTTHFDHPLRALQDLVAYNYDHSFRVQLECLGGLEQALTTEKDPRRIGRLLAVVERALRRYVDYQKSDRKTFTFGSGPLYPRLNLDEVKKLRRQALDAVVQFAYSPDAAVARRALQVLLGLLSPPTELFGREVTGEELAAWLPEAKACADILVDLANSASDSAVSFDIQEAFRKKQEREGWRELSSYLEERTSDLSVLDESVVYRALLPYYSAYGHLLDSDEAVARHGEDVGKAVAMLLSRPRLEDMLRDLAEAAEAVPRAAPQELIDELVKRRPSIATEMSKAVLTGPYDALQGAVWPALAQWVAEFPDEAFEAMNTALDTESETIYAGIAHGYCYDWLRSKSRHREKHLAILRRLITSPFKNVMRMAVSALFLADKDSQEDALDLIMGADCGDGDLLEFILSQLEMRSRGEQGVLSDKRILQFLDKIKHTNSLDDGDYHTKRFLDSACDRMPEAVVRCLLKRVEHAATQSRDEDTDYQPLPYDATRFYLTHLAKAPEFLDLLREIREYALRQEWQYGFWIGRLFIMASSGLTGESLAVLKEWVDTGEANKIVAVARILQEASHGFVFAKHEFVAHLLTSASELNEQVLRSVGSSLFAVAYTGEYSSTPGQPPRRLVEDVERAGELAETYSSNREVYNFYRAVAESADRRIKESLAEDAEWVEE